MGADLLAYVLVGPRNLDKGLGDSAVSAAQERIDLCIKWAGEEKEGMPKEVNEQFNAWELWDDWDVDDVASLDAEESVKEFMELWNGNYRDAASREDPNDPTRQITVAGEMSWGDEPEGAYQICKNAVRLGVTDVFEVR